MLKKLILIENNKKYQFETKEELVEYLLGNGYYQMSKEEKKELLDLNSKAQCLNTEFEPIELEDVKNKNIENSFIIYDETTYILSLLLQERIILLENIEANIFTKSIDKTQYTDNYIIVNKFAKRLLEEYIEK